MNVMPPATNTTPATQAAEKKKILCGSLAVGEEALASAAVGGREISRLPRACGIGPFELSGKIVSGDVASIIEARRQLQDFEKKNPIGFTKLPPVLAILKRSQMSTRGRTIAQKSGCLQATRCAQVLRRSRAVRENDVISWRPGFIPAHSSNIYHRGTSNRI